MTANVTTAVNRPYVPADGASLTAEIEVEPGEQEATPSRHVALCIDTSGSMQGEKIQRARDGASWVFGLLEPDDYVSVVAFDSDATVILSPTKWADTSRDEAMSRIDQLSAGGGTDMYEGLKRAAKSLASVDYQADGDNAVRRLLLLSDGKDNSHEPADFTDLAKQIDGGGIRIQSAGIGTDYNEDTIRTLGETARGEWAHLEGPGDIESFFGDAVEEAADVVAADARLEIDVADGVEVSEVYRALPQAQEVAVEWEDNTAVVPLPDLVERERQEVVLKTHAPSREFEADEDVSLAEVTLTSQGQAATGSVDVTYTDDAEKLAEHDEAVSLDFRQTVVKTELGKGNVEAAETQLEKMTKIHGEDAAEVQEAEKQTQLVKEGGRAERNRATKIVDDEGLR
ncbi:vWA domain-containing protein [Halobacteriales archaeon Cl-PHB]